ncbi:MAG: transcriptional repressor [Succinivibrio sp.]|uniref:Transcriptional repressor n=1 Tax=Succinivibrio faecicola TaxID=2820300 RepID=A0ABS7DFS4_9GAMM|nr:MULTISPECIES: transcriptional repressor [Succinivibrio]MBW7570053.1 transcriptional repressor [Succinivibrio faecicola]MCI6939129.1 transcriptional repressor [Succinatimonas hippei]MDD6206797.1 transcriptional repressor [Succinivibrio sp.]
MDENEKYSVDALTEDTIRKLEQSGLRMTIQRRHIIEILTSSKCTSPKELWYEAKEYVPDLGIATVYRLINRLEQIGVISKARNLGMQNVEPKLGTLKDKTGNIIKKEGSTQELAALIKQGLMTSGKIKAEENIKLSLVGDKINIQIS